MSKTILTGSKKIARKHQNKLLKNVKGRTVLVLRVPGEGDEDKDGSDEAYFQGLLKRNSARSKTLEITLDRKLFNQILAAADTLEKDVRSGKLHTSNSLTSRHAGK
jgi:hypothetical protein